MMLARAKISPDLGGWNLGTCRAQRSYESLNGTRTARRRARKSAFWWAHFDHSVFSEFCRLNSGRHLWSREGRLPVLSPGVNVDE